MRVIGIHTYAGGFIHGLKFVDGIEVIGSYETYKQSFKMADLIGSKRIDGPEQADVVVANPPCSRFSHMMCGAYSKNQRHHLADFKELQEIVDFTIATNASVLWWETGPLIATSGLEMVNDVSKALSKEWGTLVQTLMVSIDTLYTGLPQRRPRTHILHFRDNGAIFIPGVPTSQWPIGVTLHDFVKIQTRGIENNFPVNVFHKGEWVTDAKWWTTLVRSKPRGFESTKPVMYDELSTHAVTVLGGRFFSWEDENRFWSTPEYAAVMGYPVDVDWYSLTDSPHQWPHIHGIMTRSVSPWASSWVAENVLLPAMEESPPKGSIMPEKTSFEDIFRYKLVDHRLKAHLVQFKNFKETNDNNYF